MERHWLTSCHSLFCCFFKVDITLKIFCVFLWCHLCDLSKNVFDFQMVELMRHTMNIVRGSDRDKENEKSAVNSMWQEHSTHLKTTTSLLSAEKTNFFFSRGAKEDVCTRWNGIFSTTQWVNESLCYCRFFSVGSPDTWALTLQLCTSARVRFVLALTGPSVTSEQGRDQSPMTQVRAS